MKWIKKVGALITPKTVKNVSEYAGKVSDNMSKKKLLGLLIIIIALLLLGYGAIESEIFLEILKEFS